MSPATLAAARPWGRCSAGQVEAGDGASSLSVRLECTHGALDAALVLESDSHRLTALHLAPSADQLCVP